MNNTVVIACYKGKKTTYDYVATTLFKYSHIEIVVNGISYSSSLRDGGVRSKKIEFNYDNWNLYYLGIAKKKNVELFLEFFEATKNCDYDRLSLIMKLLGISKDVQIDKYTCYEYVARAFNILFEANISLNLFPNELQKEIRCWK